jgi:hypothetical protein
MGVTQRRTLQLLVDALGVALPDRDAVLAAAAARERRAPWVSGFCELPRGAADFTARANELATLQKIAARGPVRLGGPDLGPSRHRQTTLVIRTAEVPGGAFRDGCFFVDMSGMSGHPVGPAEAASRLLRALGVRAEGENWLGALRLAADGDHAWVVEVAGALHRFANHWVYWRH